MNNRLPPFSDRGYSSARGRRHCSFPSPFEVKCCRRSAITSSVASLTAALLWRCKKGTPPNSIRSPTNHSGPCAPGRLVFTNSFLRSSFASFSSSPATKRRSIPVEEIVFRVLIELRSVPGARSVERESRILDVPRHRLPSSLPSPSALAMQREQPNAAEAKRMRG